MDPKDRKDITTGTSNPTPTGTAATRARVLDSSGSPLKGETIVGEKKVPNVVEKVSDVASGIVNKVSESIDYDKIRDTAGDYYKKSIEYSKQKPGLALGISLGVGVLLGYLLAPKKPSYYRTVNCVTKDVTTLLLDRLF